jgi:hypothetical protein
MEDLTWLKSQLIEAVARKGGFAFVAVNDHEFVGKIVILKHHTVSGHKLSTVVAGSSCHEDDRF